MEKVSWSATHRRRAVADLPLSGATDLLVCAALGVDLADCVYPTRTAVRPVVALPPSFLVDHPISESISASA